MYEVDSRAASRCWVEDFLKQSLDPQRWLFLKGNCSQDEEQKR